MTSPDERELHAETILRQIAEGVTADGGAELYPTLVRHLAEALGTTGAWVTEYFPEERRLKALAFWYDGGYVDDFDYPVAGTPCERVVEQPGLLHIPDRVMELYPRDPDLIKQSAVSYLGVALLDVDGTVIGHLAVIDGKPMPVDARGQAAFQIVAGRAAAELRRRRRDAALAVSDARLATLEHEASLLREDLRSLSGFGEIIGASQPMRRLLASIAQVAGTDATVLITGETGTGKELIARAIHAASRRSAAPLITLNCAAIPATLIESEFFGHEKGAFTGATQRREGRFALADAGTIFLDEIGELPRDLQSKLLRVLQEGEFEPVGSSRTRRVDVRVLAATNRDLQREVAEGRFREDLYSRLNVFPIESPPLRQRGDDIIQLARAFMDRSASRIGRRLQSLSADDGARLRSYHWPGNVRELQNVIERAVITAIDGRLNLAMSLPDAGVARSTPETMAETAGIHANATSDAILTADQLEEFERSNLRRALEASQWKVSGPDGAAARLGMKASTLSSRLKALGIEKPAS